MTYRDQFEPYYGGIDTILIGIQNSESQVMAWHLCPYSNDWVKKAFSFESMMTRVEVIDKILTECVNL